MKNSWVLWLLTGIILISAILGIILFYCKILNIDELSAFGSIFAAAGSFIAIIWFYNSLQQQNIQLNEQRQQFQLEFNNLRLESKRSVIAIAKTILDDMETKVNNSLKDIGKLENLHTVFMAKAPSFMTPITESKNPEVVLDAIENFNSILLPARTFLSFMKDAGTLFLEHDGVAIINDDGEPEWFIDSYQKYLKDKPFISRYLPTAIILAEVMIRLKLKAILIAFETSAALINSHIMKEDAVLKDVSDFQEKNNYLPKIAEKWLETKNITLNPSVTKSEEVHS